MEVQTAICGAASCILFLPGLATLACSLYMFFSFATVPSSRVPFTVIVLARTVSHFGDAIIYGIYFPIRILLWNIGLSWKLPYIDGLVVVFWFVLSPTEFILALNRIAAINLPSHYKTMFSMKNTTIMLALSWVVGLIVYGLHFECWVSFDFETFELAYPSQACARVDQLITHFFIYPMLLLSLVLAVVAFIQIILRTKKQGNLQNKRQWLLFAQAPSQILCWALATLIWTTDVRQLYDTKLWKILTVPFPQILGHCLESIVIVYFHFAYKKTSHGNE